MQQIEYLSHSYQNFQIQITTDINSQSLTKSVGWHYRITALQKYTVDVVFPSHRTDQWQIDLVEAVKINSTGKRHFNFKRRTIASLEKYQRK